MEYAKRVNWTETQDALREAIRKQRGAQTTIARRRGIAQPSVAGYVSKGANIPPEHLDDVLDVLGLEILLVPQSRKDGADEE